jgi:hypothetical protein
MFNKPAPSAPSQTTSAPSESASSWRWDLIADAVPALPCGVVTLIAISDDHPFESHTATVGDLMATLFARTERFAYVVVGDQDGPMTEVFAQTLNEEQDGLAVAYVDRDYKVMARLGDGGGHVYSCGIPSLDNVERFLAAEDPAQERLVILDGFERARPYPAAGPSAVPDGVPVSPYDLDAWRTADLRAFAAARPNVPTVVVWHGAEVEREGAKRSIGDASDVVLLHMVGEDRDWLSVNVRSNRQCADDL